jgi:putative colanic acid biosynthesis acetyltransferase WcaF
MSPRVSSVKPATPDENGYTAVRVIPLAKAPGEQATWTKPKIVIYLWALTELLFVTNPFQFSSRIRIAALRLFGAKIGKGVIFRPRTRVKFAWNLEIGDDCWIGEGVWFHNQNKITVGHDVCISQETFITTGSHRYKTDMGLITRPVVIESGVWIAARCVVTASMVRKQESPYGAGSIVND